MELTRLKVNSQYRPCVDEAPYFSWVITSEKKYNADILSYYSDKSGRSSVGFRGGRK
jgi:alpha-L-rhamnosidase